MKLLIVGVNNKREQVKSSQVKDNWIRYNMFLSTRDVDDDGSILRIKISGALHHVDLHFNMVIRLIQ